MRGFDHKTHTHVKHALPGKFKYRGAGFIGVHIKIVIFSVDILT